MDHERYIGLKKAFEEQAAEHKEKEDHHISVPEEVTVIGFDDIAQRAKEAVVII